MINELRARQVVFNLNKLAREIGKDVNELRTILAIERIIARMVSVPLLARSLVFKGGFVLLKQSSSDRYTRDLDAVALNIPQAELILVIKTALKLDLDDGFWFGEVTTIDLPNALRLSFPFYIGVPNLKRVHKFSKISIDLALEVHQLCYANQGSMMSILSDFPIVEWQILPVEYIIAEKLETFISRADENSRGKDIYDLILLLSRPADCADLKIAIFNVFNSRQTILPDSFYEFGLNLNTKYLEFSWTKILTKLEVGEFNLVWSHFLDILQVIDRNVLGVEKIE